MTKVGDSDSDVLASEGLRREKNVSGFVDIAGNDQISTPVNSDLSPRDKTGSDNEFVRGSNIVDVSPIDPKGKFNFKNECSENIFEISSSSAPEQENLPFAPPTEPQVPTPSSSLNIPGHSPSTSGTSTDLERITDQSIGDDTLIVKSELSPAFRELRAYAPYSKPSSREKERWEERRLRRAERIRKSLAVFSKMIAPYREGFVADHLYEAHCRRRDTFNSSSSSEDAEMDHLQVDAMYADLYDEAPKESLVSEYVALVEKVEALEMKLHLRSAHFPDPLKAEDPDVSSLEAQLRSARLTHQRLALLDVDAELAKIRVFRTEIGKLARENSRLQAENDLLCIRLADRT